MSISLADVGRPRFTLAVRGYTLLLVRSLCIARIMRQTVDGCNSLSGEHEFLGHWTFAAIFIGTRVLRVSLISCYKFGLSARFGVVDGSRGCCFNKCFLGKVGGPLGHIHLTRSELEPVVGYAKGILGPELIAAHLRIGCHCRYVGIYVREQILFVRCWKEYIVNAQGMAGHRKVILKVKMRGEV